MDTVVGKLIYKITGDNAQLKSAMGDSSRGMKRLAGRAKSTGAMITKYLTGAAFVAAGKALVDLGSDAEELASKFSVVFGDVADETNDWIKTYAKAVSRGRDATKQYLTSLQDIRTGFGDSIPAAADFSKAVLGITNDLSSFSNVDVDETFAAINSGLSGQFEALRKLGVGLNVAIIDQGKYAQSLGKTWLQMSNLEKQEAVLSGIMEQSGNATRQNISSWRDYDYTLGDASLTADSLANKMKGVGQSVKDVGDSVAARVHPPGCRRRGDPVGG